jgi:glycosyltransferase involved in cell wall biosynthesis
MSLTVLITNICMDWPSGTVIYARDLALELQRQGHRPIVYTWLKGRASSELAAAGVEVVDSLWQIHDQPDVIHGHHRALVRGALLRFPGVPAVAFCHNHTDPWDAPAPDPGLRRYFGVSELCVKRLLSVGAPGSQTELRTNFVDLRRFAPRPPLPPRPTRALVFSNYATADTQLPAIEEACRRLDVPLDVAGRGVGRVSERPEQLLAEYDLVFAKAKAAMEAMAVGAAVILCDFGGLGPMVTTDDFDRLRSLNFGLAALVDAWTPEGVVLQVNRYDPVDAGRVQDLVRSRCGLERAVGDLVRVYEQVIEEAANQHVADAGVGSTGRSTGRRLAVLRYRASKVPLVAFYRAFGLGPRQVPAPVKPVYRVLRAAIRRLLWVR